MDWNTIGILTIAIINFIGLIIGVFVKIDNTIIKTDIRKVEVATNSMKDALVAATAKAAFAAGEDAQRTKGPPNA